MKYIYATILTLFSIGLISSCTDLEFPAEGSIADKTPPQAVFTYTLDQANYQKVTFNNFSISSTDYEWDFGNGLTSNEKNPTVTFADGSYLVTLISSDKLNVSDTISDSIHIEKPTSTFQPIILNPGYDEVGDDSYRDFWRNGDLGGVIQITTGPIENGVRAAKLPSAGDRIGYQEFAVEEDVDYIVTFWYTMKTSPAGELYVHILDGPVTDPTTIAARTIESKTLTDQTDDNLYVKEEIEFNSGTSSTVAIYYGNVDTECRIDSWSIKVKP